MKREKVERESGEKILRERKLRKLGEEGKERCLERERRLEREIRERILERESGKIKRKKGGKGRERGLEREKARERKKRKKEENVVQNWCQQMPPMDCVS